MLSCYLARAILILRFANSVQLSQLKPRHAASPVGSLKKVLSLPKLDSDSKLETPAAHVTTEVFDFYHTLP